MFQITRKSDYAVELLTRLAKHGKGAVVSLRNLTANGCLPYRFASQVIVSLKEAGLLGSKEGLGGGYFLTRDPEEISVLKVIQVLEGEQGLVQCAKQQSCDISCYCCSRPTWKQIQENIEEVLNAYTLADFVRESEVSDY